MAADNNNANGILYATYCTVAGVRKRKKIKDLQIFSSIQQALGSKLMREAFNGSRRALAFSERPYLFLLTIHSTLT